MQSYTNRQQIVRVSSGQFYRNFSDVNLSFWHKRLIVVKKVMISFAGKNDNNNVYFLSLSFFKR